jgi:hypothetical protein
MIFDFQKEKYWPDGSSHFGMAGDLRLIAILAPMGLVPAIHAVMLSLPENFLTAAPRIVGRVWS